MLRLARYRPVLTFVQLERIHVYLLMNIPNLHRRDFVWIGLSLGALAMTDLLAKEAGPLTPRQPMHAPKAKNVIMLFMEGGPSQVDTFDPKPKLDALHKTESKSTRGLRRFHPMWQPV